MNDWNDRLFLMRCAREQLGMAQGFPAAAHTPRSSQRWGICMDAWLIRVRRTRTLEQQCHAYQLMQRRAPNVTLRNMRADRDRQLQQTACGLIFIAMIVAGLP